MSGEKSDEVVEVPVPVPASGKRFLSADEILSFDDVQTVDVEVPEWGGAFVKLRSLRGDEAQKFADEVAGKKLKDTAVRIVLMSAVKEDGVTPLFTSEALVKLRLKSMRAILRLQAAALKLNGLSEEEKEEAKND